MCVCVRARAFCGPTRLFLFALDSSKKNQCEWSCQNSDLHHTVSTGASATAVAIAAWMPCLLPSHFVHLIGCAVVHLVGSIMLWCGMACHKKNPCLAWNTYMFARGCVPAGILLLTSPACSGTVSEGRVLVNIRCVQLKMWAGGTDATVIWITVGICLSNSPKCVRSSWSQRRPSDVLLRNYSRRSGLNC